MVAESSQDFLDLLEIVGMVSGDSDSARGDKAAEELFEIWGVKKASFVMAFFRPGVGEIDVETFYGTIRYKIDYEMCSVGANYSDIFHRPSPDAVDGVAIVFSCPLDAEEIDLRLGLGLVEQESGTA